MGDSAGGCDPVVGTPASGVSELCSSGVGVKWAPPLVGEGSVPSQLEAELVDCSSLGSVDMFFVGGDVATSVGSRRTELLGGPPVGEAGGLCGELVQVAVGGEVSARRESVEGMDADTLCSLSPAVKMQRAKRVLQTMVPWYSCRARRGRRESLPGLTERPRARAASPRPAGCGGSRAARAAAGEARRAPRGSVSCSSSRARRASPQIGRAHV